MMVSELEERKAGIKAAGLGSIPGGGGEILVDRVRQRVSPLKAMSDDWLEVMDIAHRLGITGVSGLRKHDLIFSILDKPNRKTDTELADHILQSHKGGEIHEHLLKTSDELFTKAQEATFMKHVIPVFDPEFLRKYIAYAKRNIFPVLTSDAIEILQNYYVDFRSSSKDSVPFTPRQLEAFVRLAEASARIRLSQEASVEDAKRGIAIIDQYLRRVGTDRETGKFDIDIIATGYSHSQHDRMRIILDIIKKLSSESKDEMAARSDIISEAEIQGIESRRVEEILDRMNRDGQIHEPGHGKYRLTGQ
jgi:replicative DNA helicase Mcm